MPRWLYIHPILGTRRFEMNQRVPMEYDSPRIVEIGDLVDLTAFTDATPPGKCGIDADGQSGLLGNDHSCS